MLLRRGLLRNVQSLSLGENIILHLSLLSTYAIAQSSSPSPSQSQSQSVSTITGSITGTRRPSDFDWASIVTLPPTITPSTFSSLLSSGAISIGSSGSSNGTITSGSSNATASTSPTTTSEQTRLEGGTRTPATNTAAAPRPSNTQPCNGYPQFCSRKYSNITEVAAHNSPFARERNVQSNQQYGVTQQLDDGIRVLQGQAHYINGTLYYCHTSCDLLNTGPVEDYLRDVVAWLERNPFEVITIIFGNYDWRVKDSNGNATVTAAKFAQPITDSGLLDYIYQPPSNAMRLQDWPTLGEMILQNKRVVTFIDYNFNTNEVPYLLWEFYSVWETPFSPTNISFPCTVQRPDGISRDQASSMMFMANHNLNTQVDIAGSTLLIPNVAQLAQTNGMKGEGSLGKMVEDCEADWNRPPNFLLVDYYNYGDPNGTVFRVAAEANNVPFNNKPCCGTAPTSSASGLVMPPRGAVLAATFAAVAVAVFVV